MKPNLTFTYGMRWSCFPPPWETNGLQVAPNINLGNLLDQHVLFMQYGYPANTDPLIQFNLAGPANNGPGNYRFDKDDIVLRFCIAWSLRRESNWATKLFCGSGKTVFHAVFRKMHDRFR